jgi:uncharacterized membrane protein
MLGFLETAGLGKLERAVAYGVVLAIVLLLIADIVLARRGLSFDYQWITFFMRWLHVLSGVMWIGLLWYFNFVQIPSMPKIPDEQKPAVSKVIAPTALFWFRWAALATVITGLILAWLNEYIGQALILGIGVGGGRAAAIGIGMWLGLIMAYNVWMIIWPNQQKALGLVDATADEKKAAARTAMLVSRLNTVLSVPMLYFMVGAQNIY